MQENERHEEQPTTEYGLKMAKKILKGSPSEKVL
jgi:hypothetical protein